ncbi:hypothetical protein ACSBR1_020803 [Camellia fascicularis]
MCLWRLNQNQVAHGHGGAFFGEVIFLKKAWGGLSEMVKVLMLLMINGFLL